MISDWISSQNPILLLIFLSGYGFLIQAMPETRDMIQSVIDSAAITPQESLFDKITSIAKTIISLLVMFSLFALQMIKIFEIGIGIIKNWRRKKEGDE